MQATHSSCQLQSLAPNPRIVVIGASGGIGGALVESLATDCPTPTIHALSRPPQHDGGNVRHCFIDIAEEESIRAAAEIASRDGPLDLVIVASGILHRGSALQPEKSMRALDAEALLEVLRVNAVGPAMVAKHFLSRLRTEHKTVFAALSARVGSISDNRLGGWASYRASKAALNMLLKTLAVEHARQWPGSVVVALHPGTVDTPLSKPFSSRVPAERLFAPSQSARHLLRVIDGLTSAATGGFVAWDGTPIQY
jgi:NAD(P)-dependent dehydrogenase (short-subunit alcohol dehydrogenase family)